jgi:guanylate kinase
VYGRLYGSPREPVERAVAEGWNIVLNIDVQGAARLREQGVEGVYVFLQPPSLAELERRLRGRRTDDDATIARRLATAEREMAEAPRYDAVVVNDELVRAADEVRRIALARGAGPEARASGEGGAGAGAARGAAHEAARGAEAAS